MLHRGFLCFLGQFAPGFAGTNQTLRFSAFLNYFTSQLEGITFWGAWSSYKKRAIPFLTQNNRKRQALAMLLRVHKLLKQRPVRVRYQVQPRLAVRQSVDAKRVRCARDNFRHDCRGVQGRPADSCRFRCADDMQQKAVEPQEPVAYSGLHQNGLTHRWGQRGVSCSLRSEQVVNVAWDGFGWIGFNSTTGYPHHCSQANTGSTSTTIATNTALAVTTATKS
jgi:hypothetical protein